MKGCWRGGETWRRRGTGGVEGQKGVGWGAMEAQRTGVDEEKV